MEKKNDFLRLDAKRVVMMGILIAIQIIFTRYLSLTYASVRLGFNFIPMAITGALMGPLYGGLAGGLADLLGFAIAPSGGFLPGFVLSSVVKCAIYGIGFYKKELSVKRIIITGLIAIVLVDMTMNTVWLVQAGYIANIETFWLRMAKNLVTGPIELTILVFLFNKQKILKRIVR